MMDLDKVIDKLEQERAGLENVIATLKQLRHSAAVAEKRTLAKNRRTHPGRTKSAKAPARKKTGGTPRKKKSGPSRA